MRMVRKWSSRLRGWLRNCLPSWRHLRWAAVPRRLVKIFGSARSVDGDIGLANLARMGARVGHSPNLRTSIERVHNSADHERALAKVLSSYLFDDSYESRDRTYSEVFMEMITHRDLQSRTVADVLSWELARQIEQSDTDIRKLCRLYEYIYGLYWCSAERLSDMRYLRENAVLPFERFISTRSPRRERHGWPKTTDSATRIGFLSHYSHFALGNEVGRVVHAIASAFVDNTDASVYVYNVQYVDETFVASLGRSGISVRSFPQGQGYETLDELMAAIRDDSLDVVVTDIASSIATYLFTCRVAPIQAWIDMGYPYWGINECDWVFLPSKDYHPSFGFPDSRFSYVRLYWDRSLETTSLQISEASVSALSLTNILKGRFVIGSFARTAKFSTEFLRVMAMVLDSVDDAHFLIIGEGQSARLDHFLSVERFRGRTTFVNQAIDLYSLSDSVDAVADTFPFVGGGTVQIMGTLGKPTVSMLAGDWDRLIRLERDPELVCRSANEYVDKFRRLRTDQNYYRDRSSWAQQASRRASDPQLMVADIQEGLELARRQIEDDVNAGRK